MKVREFKLVNEKGQEYSLMDIENYCLLTSANGLGVTYSIEYEQLGYTFVESFSKIQQGKITGQANFLKYENYKKLIDFIASSESIKISYKVPYDSGTKEYFKDIKLQVLNKTEKDKNGILSETITFDCLSLWYEQLKTVHQIGNEENVMRWDFKWDSKMAGYDIRRLEYVNQGHVEASIQLEIIGNVLNPAIELYIDGELYQTVTIKTLIGQYEKLLYSSKENEFYIEKELADGTRESLFDLDIINFENDNVIRIPKNRSCEIRLVADNDITNANLTIFAYYIAV